MKRIIKSFWKLLFLALLFPGQALAVPVAQPVSTDVPCAVLEKSGGEVQVLDSTRTQVLDSSPKSGIPCGGWVSVKTGWAEVRHRDGYIFHASADAFFEIPENKPEGRDTGDHVVLYRGEVYARIRALKGQELRVMTPNGRARIKQGSAVVVYNKEDEETQLIGLEDEAWLENRFEPSRQIRVGGGEATTLNLRLLRVVPSGPKAVSVSSITPKLHALALDEKELGRVLKIVKARNERGFPSSFAQGAQGAEVQSGRSLASKKRSNYTRHPAGIPQAQTHWNRRLLGGEKSGEKILFPEKFEGKVQRAGVTVEDPAHSFNMKKRKEEDAEKKRLMQELLQIKVD